VIVTVTVTVALVKDVGIRLVGDEEFQKKATLAESEPTATSWPPLLRVNQLVSTLVVLGGVCLSAEL
jgi:hypothetical protein